LRKPRIVCEHCLLGKTAIDSAQLTSNEEEQFMKLSEGQISALLSRLGQETPWTVEAGGLVRDFKFENFKAAMSFVNQVADVAEAMDHHPDILVHGWNNVRLRVMTHDQNALTEKDFKLAEQVNQLR
jgi:4a-hydroxytetrahydrobiopterin dehydratase